MEELVGDVPLTIAREEGEHVRSSRLGAGQPARPTLDFEMNDSDALDDFNTRKARTDIRRRTILIDPLKDVLDGPAVFDALAVAGNGGGGMKRGAHELAVAGTGIGDIAVDGASNGVVFGEVGVIGVVVR